jgi:hypothetical protein
VAYNGFRSDLQSVQRYGFCVIADLKAFRRLDLRSDHRDTLFDIGHALKALKSDFARVRGYSLAMVLFLPVQHMARPRIWPQEIRRKLARRTRQLRQMKSFS